MSKYIYLKFENAKLFYPIKGKNDENFTHPDIEGKVENDTTVADMENLIPHHCVSNMLHYLCGLTPVPFKDRIGFIEKNDRIDDAARNTFIRIDSYYNPEEKNSFYREIKNTNKAHRFNSHLKCGEEFGFETLSGTNVLTGEYSFERLKVNMGNTSMFNMVMDFIKDIVNVEGKAHMEVWNELHDKMGTPEFIEKRDRFIENHPEVIENIETNFKKLIFDIGPFVSSSTTDWSKRRALFNQKGVGYTLSLSGDMVIEVDDDIISLINEGPMTATLLDGGLVTVTGLKNWIDIDEYDANWKKIC